MTLKELKEEHNINTDKESRHHTYLDIYEELFNGFKDEDISVLEIGILEGESLKLWSKYFRNGNVYGIDTFERVPYNVVENSHAGHDNIYLAGVDSVYDTERAVESRKDFYEAIGDVKFKVIIDDGLHRADAQISTYNNFINLLDTGGVYIIEDIRDWDGYGAGNELDIIKKELPNIEIINMNDRSHIADNILGIYKKES